MKLCFRIVLDEPTRIDEAWPLTLPNGRFFRVIHEDGLAIAFEVEIALSAEVVADDNTQFFQSVRGSWYETRQYFNRVKSYLQCHAEVNFDPLELELIFVCENEEEKKWVGIDKMVVGRAEYEKAKRGMDFETLSGIAIGSIGEATRNDYFIGDLKNLSLRAAREGRYVDSFRYGFLLIDALFGNGQFKTRSLQATLKSDSEFVEMVQEACVVQKEKIRHPNDEIEKLICGDFSESMIIDHLVAKRGDYFHGRRGVSRHGVAPFEEGKALGDFVGEITDLICKREIGKVLNEESWKCYNEAAEASGNVVQLRYEATIIDQNCGNRVKSRHMCKMPGSLHNKWNRLMWAYDALVSLKASNDTHEVETIVGRHVDSGSMVFFGGACDLRIDFVRRVGAWKKRRQRIRIIGRHQFFL